MNLGLQGRHATLTGGGWTIGEVIARDLAGEGVDRVAFVTVFPIPDNPLAVLAATEGAA